MVQQDDLLMPVAWLGAADDGPGPVAMAAVSRLVPLWSEACREAGRQRSRTAAQDRWATAAQLLLESLVLGERVVAQVDPQRGRRDWRTRQPDGDTRAASRIPRQIRQQPA